MYESRIANLNGIVHNNIVNKQCNSYGYIIIILCLTRFIFTVRPTQYSKIGKIK